MAEAREKVAEIDVTRWRSPVGESSSQDRDIERQTVERHQETPFAGQLWKQVKIPPGQQQTRSVPVQKSDG